MAAHEPIQVKRLMPIFEEGEISAASSNLDEPLRELEYLWLGSR